MIERTSRVLRGPAGARAKARAKALIQRGIAWYVMPAAEDAARRATDSLHDRLIAELEPGDGANSQELAVSVELLRAEVASLRHRVEQLQPHTPPAGKS